MRDTIDINSNDNALFITSQCNNRCVMCCQPPLLRNDLDGYFQKNMALIDSAPRELRSLGITGGEPTLLGDRLFELLRHIRMKLPETEIHLLTNGRAFVDKEYARKLAECDTEKILLGIPLHADYAGDHDAITQVKGSFEETMLGLYNLGRYRIAGSHYQDEL
jgi:MoaA/NifB/PqqE/SkfB family radical SAM enzyme